MAVRGLGGLEAAVCSVERGARFVGLERKPERAQEAQFGALTPVASWVLKPTGNCPWRRGRQGDCEVPEGTLRLLAKGMLKIRAVEPQLPHPEVITS